MKFYKIGSAVFGLLSLVAGCASDPNQGTTTANYWRATTVYNGQQLNGINLNGATWFYNGINFNGINLNGINLNGINLNGINLNGSDLRGTPTGTSTEIGGASLKYYRLTGIVDDTEEMPMQIMDVTVDSEDPSNPNLYYVSFIETDDDDNVIDSYNPCGQDSSDNEVPAIFVSGVWDGETGAYSASSTMMTMACTNAAIGKCALWGYRPWESHREYPGATPSPEPSDCSGDNASLCTTQSLAPWHQACTRMVRADYCGTGSPHTKNGTHINVWDNFGIQEHGSPGSDYLMEAEWTEDGAKCIRRSRWKNAIGGENDHDYIRSTCPERLYINDTPCGSDSVCTGGAAGSCRLDSSTDSQNRGYCDCVSQGCGTGFTCDTSTHHCVTNDTTCQTDTTSDFFSAYGYSVPPLDASSPHQPLLDRRLIREETRDNDSLSP